MTDKVDNLTTAGGKTVGPLGDATEAIGDFTQSVLDAQDPVDELLARFELLPDEAPNSEPCPECGYENVPPGKACPECGEAGELQDGGGSCVRCGEPCSSAEDLCDRCSKEVA